MRKTLLALAALLALAPCGRACDPVASAAFAPSFGYSVQTFAQPAFVGVPFATPVVTPAFGFSTFGFNSFATPFVGVGGFNSVFVGGRRGFVSVNGGGFGGGVAVAQARGGLFGRRSAVAVAGPGGAAVARVGRR